jgi:hypothetical protein
MKKAVPKLRASVVNKVGVRALGLCFSMILLGVEGHMITTKTFSVSQKCCQVILPSPAGSLHP